MENLWRQQRDGRLLLLVMMMMMMVFRNIND